VPTESVPPWMRALAANLGGVNQSVADRGGAGERLMRAVRQTKKIRNPRPAAVLVLLSGAWEGDPLHRGGLPADAEILLTQRASTMRTHAGQVAFPGGARDPGDDYPVGTALREAVEETGLDTAGVDVLAVLDTFRVPRSGFEVVPVIGYSERPSDVGVVNVGETSRVVRVALRDLLNPRNRFQVHRKAFGTLMYRGPAFSVDDMLVWGFTGGLVAAIIEAAGWEVPWDKSDSRDLTDELTKAGQS
jgi:8-oxo-dGTP pyrophosphatase MutT (NUDIX family)